MSLLDKYNEAMARLRADVNDVVHNDMRDGIAVSLVDSAQRRVYDAYSPKYYERRFTLTDPSHYRFYPTDMGIEVDSPITGNPAYKPPASSGWNPGYISHIIESGDGYPWAIGKETILDNSEDNNKGVYWKPRPYLSQGLKDYVEDGRANEELAAGLRARGYIVE